MKPVLAKIMQDGPGSIWSKLSTATKLKVCITGASGFLGLWTAHVMSKEFEVFAITRSDSDTSELEKNSRISVHSEDNHNWAKVINEIEPDILIMFDWQGVGNSLRNHEVQHSNLKRIRDFVNALNPIRVVIGVGSQAELGPREDEILDDDVSSPTTEYGRAKCEVRNFLTRHFRDTETNFKWGRIFSTYGAFDKGDWLIPNLVRSLNVEKPFPLTEGIQEWNYLHAFDAAEAFKLLSTAGESGIYNIGHTANNSIKETCEEIASIMGKDPRLLEFGGIPMRSDQVLKLWVSTARLQALGWRPVINLKQGLIHTVNWICNNEVMKIELTDGRNFDFEKMIL